MQAPPGSPSSQAGAAWQYHAAAVPLRVLLGSVCTAPGLHACAANAAARRQPSCELTNWHVSASMQTCTSFAPETCFYVL
jgi:hypothetical protein